MDSFLASMGGATMLAGSGGGTALAERVSNRTSRSQIAKDLADIITEGDIDRALDTLRDGLNATRSCRRGRDSSGGPNYTEEPDWTIRICAANLLLQHKHGKPVQRNLLTVDDSSKSETLSKDEAIRRLAGSVESLVEIASVYRNSVDAIDRAKSVDQVIDTERVPDLPDFSEADDNQGDAESSPDST